MILEALRSIWEWLEYQSILKYLAIPDITCFVLSLEIMISSQRTNRMMRKLLESQGEIREF